MTQYASSLGSLVGRGFALRSAQGRTRARRGGVPASARERVLGSDGAHVLVAIVGSGFAGLGVAAELRKVGIDDFVILERSQALGGAWRDNHYPGCACDVPSHLYSFSYAPKHDWSRAFAPHHEIREYMERVTDELDLRRHIVFGRELESATWDDATSAWRLRARSGETLTANVLVTGTGALSNPALPALPGIERFEGAQMHSARWDHDYDFTAKRVVVVGTGASAIQFVPQLQPKVAKLHLLQRTAPWVMPKADRAYAAWEKAAFRMVPGLRWLHRQSIFWQLDLRVLAFTEQPVLMRLLELEGKRHIAKHVRDPELRKLLTPSYKPGCKRILLSNDYYPALAQPNVEVLGATVTDVGPRSVTLSNGRTLEADAIVYGTGFAVHDYLGGIRVSGRGGRSLNDEWAGGAEAYLGTTVAGFPNLFTIVGPNTGLGHNSMIVMIEGQARYTRRAIERLRERGLRSLEVKPEVQRAYNEWVQSRNAETIWASGCKSWYLDARGKNTTLWPGFAAGFRARTELFRESDYVARAR